MIEHDTQIVAEVRDSIEAEFVSVRFIDIAGARVRRLLFTTDIADQFPVFIAPNFGSGYELRTGTRYRLSNVLICHAAKEENQDDNWTEKADFGGSSNQTPQAIGRAVQKFDLESRFAVCDLKTTMNRL